MAGQRGFQSQITQQNVCVQFDKKHMYLIFIFIKWELKLIKKKLNKDE